MFSGRHDSEVFRCVVVFVFIQVMDVLIRAQWSSHHVLRNDAVLVAAEEFSVGRWLNSWKTLALGLAVIGPPNFLWRHVGRIAPSAQPLRMHPAIAKAAFLVVCSQPSCRHFWAGLAALRIRSDDNSRARHPQD